MNLDKCVKRYQDKPKETLDLNMIHYIQDHKDT